jgi:protein MpaA
LLVGGVHGDEPSGVAALLDLTARLSSETLPHGRMVMIVPALNPDGLILGQKNAASDVDLNRNFPASNFTRAHAPGYDPGPSPMSEPESALLARVIEEQAIGAVVAVHAPFECVNFDGPASAWAGAVSVACGWPVKESLGYPTPGSLGSWLGVDKKMPVLTLELPSGPLAAFRGAAIAALASACTSADDIIWAKDRA